MSTKFTQSVQSAVSGTPLNASQMQNAMQLMLNGEAMPVQIATFLTALKMRGETITEIATAARAMRSAATLVKGPEGCLDTCGTGGDGAKTYNISTAVAFVLAGCGVTIAKHGNKAVSSLSGSSDVLAKLGVNLLASNEIIQSCLDEIGIAFLFAQRHHPAVRHVAPVRTDMGVRTIFNLLGPLTNPASAHHQLLGVYDRNLCRPLAEVLHQLGTKTAWVVHGSDGLDELTTTGVSYVAELANNEVREFEVHPQDAGLDVNSQEDLIGGDVQANANAMRNLLQGYNSVYRDIVIFNSAAGLVVAGKASDLKQGATLAADAIDSGRAEEKLNLLIKRTNA